MTSSLDDAAKAEVVQIVNNAIGARLDDLAKKFEELSTQAGTWRANLETAVATEFMKVKSEVGASSGGPWAAPDRPLTVLSPEVWVAYHAYPQLIQSPADANFVLAAAIQHAVDSGCGPESAAVAAIRMAFEPVTALVLDPAVRALPSSVNVYRTFVDAVTYHSNTAAVSVKFARYAKQKHSLQGSEWAEAQASAMKAWKAFSEKKN